MTTLRQLKRHQRGTRKTAVDLESSGPYKRVPPPKPVSGAGSESRPTASATPPLTTTPPPPPYRMPPRPLHNEPPIPGAPDQPHASTPSLHTHSSKFPIEREVTLSSTDKNSKIPILNDYLKRPNSSIAPDAPHIQMAWIEDKHRNSNLNHTGSQQTQNLQVFKAQPMNLMDSSQISELSPIRGQDLSCPPNLSQISSGAVPKNGPVHSTPESENSTSKALHTRTYHTIRDMISSRFSKNKMEPCTETELNNAESNNGVTQTTTTPTTRPEESLSPQSQLRQHGVYIGTVAQSPQQQIRIMQQNQILSRNNEIMRRNQEIRDRHQQQHQQQQQMQHQQYQNVSQQYQQYQQPQHYQHQHTQPHVNQHHIQHHTPQHQNHHMQQQLMSQQLYQQREKVLETAIDTPPRHVVESNQKTIYLDSRGLSVHTPNQRPLNETETPVGRRLESMYGQRPVIADTRMAKSQMDLSSCNDPNTPTLRYPNNMPAEISRSTTVLSRTPLTPVAQKEFRRPENHRTPDQKMSQPPPNPKPSHLSVRPVDDYTNRIPEMTHYNGQQTPNSVYHKVAKEDILREPITKNEEQIQRDAYQAAQKDTYQSAQRDGYQQNAPRDGYQQCAQKDGYQQSAQRDGYQQSSQKDGYQQNAQRDGYQQSAQTYDSSRENINQAHSGEDEGGFSKSGPLSGISSDYDKLRNSGHSDSGRGSTVYSSGKAGKSDRQIDTSPELSSEPHRNPVANENGWVDVVENELRNILDPKLQANAADSTISESISSLTPPLPPLSPTGSSDDQQPIQHKHKSLPYNSKPEYPTTKSGKCVTTPAPGKGTWSARMNSKDKSSHHRMAANKRNETPKIPQMLLSHHFDIDSMLDDNNSSDEESTTIDTHHAQTIRKQLEALETMYSEVLKLLGVRKNASHHYQPSDPRIHRRRLHGSMSSLPSSVSSRPIRDKHRRTDERKKVKDIRGINKRFQRLESHVVTLARSVAHLSSEMRTQHIMIQEMEVIRGELAALRTQTNMLAIRSHSTAPCQAPAPNTASEQVNSSPGKVKKLTKFFGEEPPLMKLFLEKLGYEKYAKVFEKERIGFVELPYLTEERLHKLGIPLGPRLRIMQEAQMGFPTFENTLCVI
nr:PREDICTED: uncharacterized protein LOC109032098 [Bemisia tabaci]